MVAFSLSEIARIMGLRKGVPDSCHYSHLRKLIVRFFPNSKTSPFCYRCQFPGLQTVGHAQTRAPLLRRKTRGNPFSSKRWFKVVTAHLVCTLLPQPSLAGLSTAGDDSRSPRS